MSKRAAALVLLAAVALAPLGSAAAQDLSYRIVREWVVLQVERDGTVRLSYNLTVGVDSGAIRRFVRVGMPVGSFEVLEVRELETGLEVELVKLVGVYSDPDRDPRGHYVSITYLARPKGGVLKASGDAAKAVVFRISEIPWGRLAFDHARILRDALRAAGRLC